MSCTNCENNTQNTSFSYAFNEKNCTNCGTSCESQIDSSCVIYTGSALTCTDIGTNITVELALKSLDTKICSIDATDIDWASFNYACLTGDGPQFTTAQEFVEAISTFVCTDHSNLTGYISSNNTVVSGLGSRTTAIENPGLATNSYLAITSGSTYAQVQGKFNTGFLTLYPLMNPSSANWSDISISPAPTTLIQAYNGLIAKQLSTNNTLATLAPLPVFNNTANCLSGGATDTLVQTINALRTYTCALPTYDSGDITATCVDPGANLTETIQNLATATDFVYTNIILGVDSDDLDLDDAGSCMGQILSIKSTSPTRYTVASNELDTAPSFLSAKLIAGDNITLDYSDNIHVVINADTTTLDYKVKSTGNDTTADYLFNKIVGGSSPTSSRVDTGLSIATTLLNPTNYETVSVYPVINAFNFASFFMTTVSNDSDLLIQFKNLMNQASAVSSANPPTDLVVTH